MARKRYSDEDALELLRESLTRGVGRGGLFDFDQLCNASVPLSSTHRYTALSPSLQLRPGRVTAGASTKGRAARGVMAAMDMLQGVVMAMRFSVGRAQFAVQFWVLSQPQSFKRVRQRHSRSLCPASKEKYRCSTGDE